MKEKAAAATPKRSKDKGPRSADAPLKVRVTAEERERIQATARKVRLPVAGLLRKLGLGYEPPSRIDQETFLELFNMRGDLGRLGGLLKLWLLEEEGSAVSSEEVRDALEKILELQGKVADLIAEMRPLIRGGK